MPPRRSGMHKKHSSPKAITRAFNKQYTDSSVPQDRTLKRLMKEVHQHLVGSNYRSFDDRSASVTIRKAGSSTAQGPDGVSVLHFHHLESAGIAFLMEFFNLSVARVDIDNLEELCQNPDPQSREATRARPLLSLSFSSAWQ